jgi:hypothetical protein
LYKNAKHEDNPQVYCTYLDCYEINVLTDGTGIVKRPSRHVPKKETIKSSVVPKTDQENFTTNDDGSITSSDECWIVDPQSLMMIDSPEKKTVSPVSSKLTITKEKSSKR